jgi:hypothetical protein
MAEAAAPIRKTLLGKPKGSADRQSNQTSIATTLVFAIVALYYALYRILSLLFFPLAYA